MRAADPDREIVALSGDYDFQFLIEELAVGAQHKLPYLHVVVNNSYLGLIRQAQRGFKMDFEVSLGFENVNTDEVEAYGVDHVAVAEGLGCKRSVRQEPERVQGGLRQGRALMEEHQVPVVLEFILERVTNIAMGTEIHNVTEFEEILCLDPSLRWTMSRARSSRPTPSPLHKLDKCCCPAFALVPTILSDAIGFLECVVATRPVQLADRSVCKVERE